MQRASSNNPALQRRARSLSPRIPNDRTAAGLDTGGLPSSGALDGEQYRARIRRHSRTRCAAPPCRARIFHPLPSRRQDHSLPPLLDGCLIPFPPPTGPTRNRHFRIPAPPGPPTTPMGPRCHRGAWNRPSVAGRNSYPPSQQPPRPQVRPNVATVRLGGMGPPQKRWALPAGNRRVRPRAGGAGRGRFGGGAARGAPAAAWRRRPRPARASAGARGSTSATCVDNACYRMVRHVTRCPREATR